MSQTDPVAERLREWLEVEGPGQVPDQVLWDTFERTRAERQQPTMRSWRFRSMTSTFRIAIAAVLLVGAGLAVQVATQPRVDAPAPRTIIVAPDGTGDALTIAEGVALAQDGDTVAVKPGTYPEHVIIDKDITVQGDGPRDEIVIVFTLDSPTLIDFYDSMQPNAITLEDSNATLRNLTINGPDHGVAIQVSGGAPTIEGFSIQMPGVYQGIGRYAIHITDGARGEVRDVTTDGTFGINDAAAPTVERLTMLQEPVIVDGAGTDTIVRHSDLQSVWIQSNGGGSILDNRIAREVDISDHALSPVIRGNVIERDGDATFGVSTVDSDSAIVGNTIRGHLTGISVGMGEGATIEDNIIEDNTTGIAVAGPASAISDGLVIKGNALCSNLTDLAAPTGSSLTLDGNEICDPGASDAP